MYLVSTTHNTECNREDFLQEACRSPRGPKFSKVSAAHSAKMEVWGSSFTDEGDDYCEYRLISEGGKTIATKRIKGY